MRYRIFLNIFSGKYCHYINKKLTKNPNDNILEMAKHLSDIDKPVWIRHVLVPFRSDYDEYLVRLDEFIKTLNHQSTLCHALSLVTS